MTTEERLRAIERALTALYDLHSCDGMRASPGEYCPVCQMKNELDKAK